ncbi:MULTISPECIES: hypothetical protein [unclassified Paenibacillus]|uniref:hypothetical protein n=1 Tax=unclassified Paenibacillus TaxID=185978 RepID=UPI000A83E294|nr:MULTISPECIES: hypothetical protein [unclassified Paenibacillus]
MKKDRPAIITPDGPLFARTLPPTATTVFSLIHYFYAYRKKNAAQRIVTMVNG